MSEKEKLMEIDKAALADEVLRLREMLDAAREDIQASEEREHKAKESERYWFERYNKVNDRFTAFRESVKSVVFLVGDGE